MDTDRRTFLKAGALAAAGLSNAASAAQDPAKGPSLEGRIFKAVKGGQQKGESVEAFFLRLKGLGFHGVESGNAGRAEEYRAAAAKTGVRVHGLLVPGHWGTRLSDPDPEVRDKGRRNMERAIRDAHALGGSSVLLVPGKVTGERETHDDVWNRSVEQVRQVVPLAAELGVRVLVETVWNGFCESPEVFRDYLDEFDSPWVGAYFDIGNMQKFAPAEEWIRTLGKRVVKLDIKDWGEKNGFCRLGEGDVDWDAVRTALHETGFAGWATREGRDRSIEDTSALIDRLLVGA